MLTIVDTRQPGACAWLGLCLTVPSLAGDEGIIGLRSLRLKEQSHFADRPARFGAMADASDILRAAPAAALSRTLRPTWPLQLNPRPGHHFHTTR